MQRYTDDELDTLTKRAAEAWEDYEVSRTHGASREVLTDLLEDAQAATSAARAAVDAEYAARDAENATLLGSLLEIAL